MMWQGLGERERDETAVGWMKKKGTECVSSE